MTQINDFFLFFYSKQMPFVFIFLFLACSTFRNRDELLYSLSPRGFSVIPLHSLLVSVSACHLFPTACHGAEKKAINRMVSAVFILSFFRIVVFVTRMAKFICKIVVVIYSYSKIN